MKITVDANLLRILACAGKVTGAGKGRNYTAKELSKYKAYISFQEGKAGKAIKLKLTPAGRQLLIKHAGAESTGSISFSDHLSSLFADFQKAEGTRVVFVGRMDRKTGGEAVPSEVGRHNPTTPSVQSNALEVVLTQMLYNGQITFTEWAEKNTPQLGVKRGVVFANSIEDIDRIAATLKFYGIPVGTLTGNEDLDSIKRKSLAFHQGKLNYMVTLKRGNQAASPFDFYAGPTIPPELFLYGEPRITSVYDFSSYDLKFTPVDWRKAKDEHTVLKFFPNKPTMDDILDLHILNKEMKSNRLDSFLKHLKNHAN